MVRAPALGERFQRRAVPAAMIAVGAALLFTILFDQGQVLSAAFGSAAYEQNDLHELFHDARHGVGVPCH